MHQIIGPTRASDPKLNVDILGVMLFLGTVALLVSLGVSVPYVFAASVVAGASVVVVIGVIVVLYIMVSRRLGWKSLPSALLAVSALWVALSGIVVFDQHWLAFTPATWLLNVLYVAALANGAYSSINRWMRIVAKLLAFSLVTATLLPRPTGGEGPFDTAKEWSINILVNDDQSQPIEGAQVLCGQVTNWSSNELGLPETLARQTDSSGHLTWTFKADPHLKIVICNAWQNASHDNSGYSEATRVVFRSGDHEVRFTLSRPSVPNSR